MQDDKFFSPASSPPYLQLPGPEILYKQYLQLLGTVTFELNLVSYIQIDVLY